MFLQTVDIAHNNRSVCSLVKVTQSQENLQATVLLVFAVKYPGEEVIISEYSKNLPVKKSVAFAKSCFNIGLSG